MISLPTDEFDQLVEQAISTIPRKYRKYLKNIVVVVEQEPRERGLLGLYQSHPPFPDKITIYQGPHQRMANQQKDLFTAVQETVIHEIGHALGMNESQVLKMERARRARFRKYTDAKMKQ